MPEVQDQDVPYELIEEILNEITYHQYLAASVLSDASVRRYHAYKADELKRTYKTWFDDEEPEEDYE